MRWRARSRCQRAQARLDDRIAVGLLHLVLDLLLASCAVPGASGSATRRGRRRAMTTMTKTIATRMSMAISRIDQAEGAGLGDHAEQQPRAAPRARRNDQNAERRRRACRATCANSTKPCAPNSRFQPSRERDARQLRLDAVAARMRGMFWITEAPMPATISRTSMRDQRLADLHEDEPVEVDGVGLGVERPGVGLFEEDRQEAAELERRCPWRRTR